MTKLRQKYDGGQRHRPYTCSGADDRINGFFAHVDAAKLRMKLLDQICAASGGPCTYTGRDMATTYKGLGITDDHFNVLVEDPIAVLEQFNVPEREKNELLSALGPRKGDIVDG